MMRRPFRLLGGLVRLVALGPRRAAGPEGPGGPREGAAQRRLTRTLVARGMDPPLAAPRRAPPHQHDTHFLARGEHGGSPLANSSALRPGDAMPIPSLGVSDGLCAPQSTGTPPRTCVACSKTGTRAVERQTGFVRSLGHPAWRSHSSRRHPLRPQSPQLLVLLNRRSHGASSVRPVLGGGLVARLRAVVQCANLTPSSGRL